MRGMLMRAAERPKLLAVAGNQPDQRCWEGVMEEGDDKQGDLEGRFKIYIWVWAETEQLPGFKLLDCLFVYANIQLPYFIFF